VGKKGGLAGALVLFGAVAGVLTGYSGCPNLRSVSPPLAGPAVAALDGGLVDGAAACAADLTDDPGLVDERDAVAYALALDPDDPASLAEAAELYLNRLPQSRERSETGLLYARRGQAKLLELPLGKGGRRPSRKPAVLRLVEGSPQALLAAQLALLEGQAQLDLGRPRLALPCFEAALGRSSDVSLQADASYERAVTLFELCQLDPARQALQDWLRRYPKDRQVAWAHHHLALTLEMLGDQAAAEREAAQAEQLAPEHFVPALAVSVGQFQTLVAAEVAALPDSAAADLRLVTLELADLPELADLTVEEPPLPPTIVGLFRGLPLGKEPSEPRSIVLYRKNLLRSVRSREALRSEVRTTLLHELGHLRGADDDELRQRGLE
jgi:predicted Zn-dependent protease with MMP-like domain